MNDELQLISKLITDIKQTTTKLTPNSKKKLSVTDIKTSIKNQKKDVTKFNESLEVYHQQVADMFKQIGKKFETIEDMKKDLKEDENLPPKTDKDKAKFETIQIKQLNVLNNNIDNLLFFLKDELYDLKNIKPEVNVINDSETKISLKPFFETLIDKIKPLDSDSFLGQIKDFVIGGVIGAAAIETIKWVVNHKEQIMNVINWVSDNGDAIANLLFASKKNQAAIDYMIEEQNKIKSLRLKDNLTASEKIKSGIKRKYGNATKGFANSMLSQINVDNDYENSTEMNNFTIFIQSQIESFIYEIYSSKTEISDKELKHMINLRINDIKNTIPHENQFANWIKDTLGKDDWGDIRDIFNDIAEQFKASKTADVSEFQIDTSQYKDTISKISKDGISDITKMKSDFERNIATYMKTEGWGDFKSNYALTKEFLKSFSDYVVDDFIPYWVSQIFYLSGSYESRMKQIEKAFNTDVEKLFKTAHGNNENRDINSRSAMYNMTKDLWSKKIKPYFDNNVRHQIPDLSNTSELTQRFEIKGSTKSVPSTSEKLSYKINETANNINVNVIGNATSSKTIQLAGYGITSRIKVIREQFKEWISKYVKPEIYNVPITFKDDTVNKLKDKFNEFVTSVNETNKDITSDEIFISNTQDMTNIFNNILNEITIYNENDITVDVQKFQNKKADETKDNYDASVEAVLKNDTSKQTINSAIDTQNSTQGVKVATGFENVGYATTQRGDYGTRGEISVKSDKVQSPTNVKGNQNSHITNVLNKTSVKTPSTKVIQVEPKIIVQNSSQQINHIDYVIDRISFRGDIPTLLNN